MPNGEELTDFDKQLADWEKQAKLNFDFATFAQEEITKYSDEMEKLIAQQGKIIQLPFGLPALTLITLPVGPGIPIPVPVSPPTPEQFQEVQELLGEATLNLERYDFYTRLYGEVPIAIAGGGVSSPDDVLALLAPPAILTPDELAEVREVISNMVAVLTGEPLPEEVIPGMEYPEPEYPPLVAPVPVTRVPISLHQLSVQEIIKTLTAPVVPESAMTKAEWEEYLRSKGYTDEDINMELQLEAEGLITAWADRNNQMEAFKATVAEMPEYKAVHWLKTLVMQPGLVLMEGAMTYFEHVSMPLAGMLYKNIIPDLEAEYQQLKKANPDISDREALAHAWLAWDAPFEGAGSWILKYLLMEGLVDPLTYVGWGIATRVAYLPTKIPLIGRWRPMAYPGRLVGSAERGAAAVFELPFDAIKWGLRKIPKTLTQRATIASHQALQYVEAYLTKATGRHLSRIGMKDFVDYSEKAIKYALDNPQLEDDIALAGREMLKHTPVDEAVVGSWSSKLGTTLRAEDITRVTIENVDNLFEDAFFRKLTTPREASGQLLKIFAVENMSDDMLKVAQRLLENRAKSIRTGATAFTKASTPLAAMRSLATKSFRTRMITEESAAVLARAEAGAFTTLLHNINLPLQAIWRNGVDRWVVRPFAEAYLTFGMYGPMNIIEDYIRSTLGGVVPRRMTIESWEKITIGLKVDPELKRFGMSEMIGPLAREGPEQNWNNWVLQLFTLGKKGWSDKLYKYAVRIPGAYGMDIRRNFLAKRYLQLLAEAGGDQFVALAKAGPRNLPKLADKRLLKDLESTIYQLKTTGNPDVVRGAAEEFTRQRILRNEVNNILKEHAELPNVARDYIRKAFDDDVIFREAGESIDRTMLEARNIVLDDFVRGPEIATQQYHQLADFLTTLEVRNPQEMATAIQAVHKMSEIYGALPDQIIAQATVRSRGLPLVERRATIDADLERVYHFLDAAGADIDRVITKLKSSALMTKEQWEALPKVAGYRAGALRPTTGVTATEGEGLYVSGTREFAQSFGDVVRGVDYLPPRRPFTLRDDDILLFLHEHPKIFDPMDVSDSPWVRLNKQAIQDVGATTENLYKTLPLANRRLSELLKAEGYDAVVVPRATVEGFAPPMLLVGRGGMLEATPPAGFTVLLDESLWKATTVASETYIGVSTRLFDTMMAKREFATEFRTLNMASRSEYFRGVGKRQMRETEFWDDFYLQMNAEYHTFNLKMAELDGQIARGIEELNMASGARRITRPPIVIEGRPLAPQDVAGLLGVRGDDISRGLLDVLTVQNNKDFFVAYVTAMTRPGDVGFTKEAVGAVYDQIAYSLRVSPESMSWITGKQIQLESMRKELHSLYNSKLLPDDEIASIGKYIDDTASAVEKQMYEPAPGRIYFTQDMEIRYTSLLDTASSRERTVANQLFESLEDINHLRVAIKKGVAPMEPATLAEMELRIASEQGFISVKQFERFAGEIASIDDLMVAGKSAEALVRLNSLRQEVTSAFTAKIKTPSIRAGLSDIAEATWKTPPKPPAVGKVLKPEYANFDDLRQSAMDEAHSWYYKEYPDYTNANAFDAMMKAIYPYWTYESQRWFWLPRAFVRHPGIFTTFERWQNNTDYGYVHIPGTSIDINPFRGTVFGTLTTRLTRRDFPEYYDALGAVGGMVEFNDFLSRFGFYPGAHIGIPLAVFGGLNQQMGETLPAIWKTPLNALIAALPESDSVKWLSEHIFSDRFREYMTIIEVNKRGYDGSHLWVKIQSGLDLTEEEQAVWDSARGEAALHGMGFEQFGLFRLRTEEQYRAYEESAKVIEELTGYTSEQQDWLRRHGYRIWDIVGGISPTNQAILQELEIYKWLGTVTPLLPSRQQTELMRLDLDWDAVMQFTEGQQVVRSQLELDFLAGRLGPREYNARLQETYAEQRVYIDKRIEENPLMTLDGRKDYYEKYGITSPVQHPMRELLNLYFSIELEDTVDKETGEITTDWDSFFAQRSAVEAAVLPELRDEWDAYIARNSTRTEIVRREVSDAYFRKYYDIWEATLATYPEDEQRLINEFLYLERTGQQLERQAAISGMTSTKTGNLLISSFRSDVSDSRAALRYANPHLDAWLFYWGRVSSFQTPQAQAVYMRLLSDTGRTGG